MHTVTPTNIPDSRLLPTDRADRTPTQARTHHLDIISTPTRLRSPISAFPGPCYGLVPPEAEYAHITGHAHPSPLGNDSLDGYAPIAPPLYEVAFISLLCLIKSLFIQPILPHMLPFSSSFNILSRHITRIPDLARIIGTFASPCVIVPFATLHLYSSPPRVCTLLCPDTGAALMYIRPSLR